MEKLGAYLNDFVEPTLKELEGDPSPRRAFLAAVAIYHAIDRAAEDLGRKNPANLRKQWGDESKAFKWADIFAHHFKHVRSHEDKRPLQWAGMLSYGDVARKMMMIEAVPIIQDAADFVRVQASKTHGKPRGDRP